MYVQYNKVLVKYQREGEGVIPRHSLRLAQSECVLPLVHCRRDEVERYAHLFPKQFLGLLGGKGQE